MFTRNHFRNQKVLVAGFGRFGACLPSSLQGFVITEDGVDVDVLDSCQAGNLSCTACGSKAGKDIRSCVRRRKTT